MRCLPVFIILLLLIPSAHSVIARPETKDDAPLASSHYNAMGTTKRWCCDAFHANCCK
uniref:Conotoxin n=1 Tax=Conus praecellens TaxID=128530 RepID=A0A291C2V9_CONPC|nr:conotoxin [Conus praecellens]